MVNKSNIVLIGFMGTGKTTVSKIVSKRLKKKYLDTDKLIEKSLRTKIPDIFNKYGEEYFRVLENQTIKRIYKAENYVISTGGGIILNNENITYLKRKGIVFLLNGSLDSIKKNLENSIVKRPLLDSEDWVKKAEEILNDRQERYLLSADYVINIDGRSLNQISNEIIKIYNNITR